MGNLQDKFCEFLLRYKQHVEPPNRFTEIKVLEEVHEKLYSQEKEINKIREENLLLNKELKEYKKKDKERVSNYTRLMKDLTDDINELIEYTCKAIDLRKYQHVDGILCKIYEVIHKLDEIPEAVK